MNKPVIRDKVRLIKQKTKSDCAICCLSMLTGIPHKKVVKLVGDAWEPDNGMRNTVNALLRLGYSQKERKIQGMAAWKIEDVDFKKFYCPNPISPSYFKEQIWGRRALLTVPSLNIPGGWHMVYWHFDRLYDPSTKETYKTFNQLVPQEVIVFMERRSDV